MKIGNIGPVGTPPVRRRDQAAKGGTGFAGEIRNDGAVRDVAPPSDVASVNVLLTVQEVGDSMEEKRKGVRRGRDLLDQLDELRHGLLTGAYAQDKLDRILRMVRGQHERIADPRLREIVQEIELRAAVELAKLGKFD